MGNGGPLRVEMLGFLSIRATEMGRSRIGPNVHGSRKREDARARNTGREADMIEGGVAVPQNRSRLISAWFLSKHWGGSSVKALVLTVRAHRAKLMHAPVKTSQQENISPIPCRQWANAV